MYCKYHAKKVKTQDGTFDSKREYVRWLQLKELQERGVISNLQRQVPFELIPSQKNEYGQVVEKVVKYYADFVYVKGGKQVVEDVKGVKTDVYILKRKLMRYIHGIEVIEV